MVDQVASKERGVRFLYLDFDSFFATAEQHFNPALRARPVGVIPLDSPHTGCIAISREAKALGLKSGVKIAEARKLVPDMIFVVARHDVYVRLHHRILKVLETCLPVTHVRSIDEVACRLLASEAREEGALATRIKDALAREFSSVLTCSIGMAPTELLAKIGAEMRKPDGFTLIRPEDIFAQIAHLPLRDLPGISGGIEARLQAAGIGDVHGLWATSRKHARAIWGNVEGERFWSELHGHPVERPPTVKRMFGHSRVLPPDWRGHEKMRVCARMLTMSAARRLRRAGLRATKLSLSFRGVGPRHERGRRNDRAVWSREARFLPSRDYLTFMRALAECLRISRRDMRFRPRSVSVMLHGLVRENEAMEDLFANQPDATGGCSVKVFRERWESVSDVMDHLCRIHRPDIISLGPPRQIPGGYLGAKIAFGRIPDAADFIDTGVLDEATHFCSA